MKRVLVTVGIVFAIGAACILGAGGRLAASDLTQVSRAPLALAKPVSIAHPDGKATVSSDETQIRAVLDTQVAAWNRGDIDAFMKYYWRSDKTLFVGANGLIRGWQAVLDRYHRGYPNRKAMGQLTFSDIEIEQDCPRAAVVVGEYHLHREKDAPSGVFTLNFRKFTEGWRIVVDHTTAFAIPGTTHN
ncbi:MAG TPA: nuclear transport factor 2 family protein [Candidatus Acidoferrales bacterium]|nr:nuclear transport factor 2 family protein [Candidatus Acidoferrales bacterium]